MEKKEIRAADTVLLLKKLITASNLKSQASKFVGGRMGFVIPTSEPQYLQGESLKAKHKITSETREFQAQSASKFRWKRRSNEIFIMFVI